MTSLDIIDTAVKIGLGAAISAVATYAVTRRTHLHELRKLRIQEATGLIRECMSKVDRSAASINQLNQTVGKRWIDRTPVPDEDFMNYRKQFVDAFNEVKDARSICLLLNYTDAAECLQDYSALINELAKYQTSDNETWDPAWVEENGNQMVKLRLTILNRLAKAYQSMYA